MTHLSSPQHLHQVHLLMHRQQRQQQQQQRQQQRQQQQRRVQQSRCHLQSRSIFIFEDPIWQIDF